MALYQYDISLSRQEIHYIDMRNAIPREELTEIVSPRQPVTTYQFMHTAFYLISKSFQMHSHHPL